VEFHIWNAELPNRMSEEDRRVVSGARPADQL
jgi:hypothetical protein